MWFDPEMPSPSLLLMSMLIHSTSQHCACSSTQTAMSQATLCSSTQEMAADVEGKRQFQADQHFTISS